MRLQLGLDLGEPALQDLVLVLPVKGYAFPLEVFLPGIIIPSRPSGLLLLGLVVELVDLQSQLVDLIQ